MRNEYSIYTKKLKSGRYWYVRFWSEKEKSYIKSKATGVEVVGKKGRIREAEKKAKELYENFINESKIKNDELFIDYLNSFWNLKSEYCIYQEGLRGKPLTKQYVETCRARINNHIASYPALKDKKLTELTRGLFQDWMIWAKDKGIGVHTINDTLNSINAALEWKVFKEELDRNPIKKLGRFAEKSPEKGIFTRVEQSMLLKINERNPRVKLCCLLATFGSLRLGEVRGLQWEDINFKDEIITIRHSYTDKDGLGPVKNGVPRVIPLMPQFKPLLHDISLILCNENPTGYVIYNQDSIEKPIGKKSIYKGFKRILKKIGITDEEAKERNITFHSGRHTFVSEAYHKGLSKFEVKALAGHLTDEMSKHYTHEEQTITMAEVKNKLL